jgi:hypothetical protein
VSKLAVVLACALGGLVCVWQAVAPVDDLVWRGTPYPDAGLRWSAGAVALNLMFYVLVRGGSE